MTVTGNLRDVMKVESAAASYVRSRAINYGIEPPLPTAATSTSTCRRARQGRSVRRCRDGTAIISVMTGIPVRHDVAMTGEITARPCCRSAV